MKPEYSLAQSYRAAFAVCDVYKGFQDSVGPKRGALNEMLLLSRKMIDAMDNYRTISLAPDILVQRGDSRLMGLPAFRKQPFKPIDKRCRE